MLKRTFHNYGYEYRHSYGLFLKGGTCPPAHACERSMLPQTKLFRISIKLVSLAKHLYRQFKVGYKETEIIWSDGPNLIITVVT